MQIEFVDRARGYSYFLEVPSASGWGNGVGGWIGVFFVVVEGCLREHRLYRVRSVWIPSCSRWKGGGRTRYCRIKSWYPVTSNGSSHPYMIIRRPAARSFFRWVVKRWGWTFLPFFSHLVSIFIYRETGSIVCVVPRCSRSARYVEYLRSLSSYLVPSNSHGSSSRLEWRVARIKYSSEAIHFETELRLLRGPGRRRYVREDVREIMHGDREGWLIPFELSLPRNMVLRNMALMQRKDIFGIWFLTFAELLCYIKLRGWNHEKRRS